MNTLKNSEVARIYNVSPSTVTLWIKNAVLGKNNLELKEVSKNRFRLKISPTNDREIEKLKNSGIKYKPSQHFKRITVSTKLQEILPQEYLDLLFLSLSEENRVPTKLSFFGLGPQYWNDVIQASKLSYIQEESKLLELNLEIIIDKIGDRDEINLIDPGYGNALLSLPLIKKLLDLNKKVNYVTVNPSVEAFNLVKANLVSLGDRITVSHLKKDIEREDIKIDSFHLRSENSCNLFLFIYDSIGFYTSRDKVIRNLQSSLLKEDFLIIINAIESSEEYLFTSETFSNSLFKKIYTYIFDLLCLPEDSYSIFDRINPQSRDREVVINFKSDIELNMKIGDKFNQIYFENGSDLVIWSYFSHTPKNLFEELISGKLFISSFHLNKTYSTVLAICGGDILKHSSLYI